MAVYLWQMVPVVVINLSDTHRAPSAARGRNRTVVGFGLFWLLILTVVMTAQMALVWLGRAVFNRALPAIPHPCQCGAHQHC